MAIQHLPSSPDSLGDRQRSTVISSSNANGPTPVLPTNRVPTFVGGSGVCRILILVKGIHCEWVSHWVIFSHTSSWGAFTGIDTST